MRVGVVTPRHAPTVGGGFTFHASVLEALGCASTEHEFVLLNIGGTDSGGWSGGRGLPLIDVQAMFPSYASSGDTAPLTELAALKLGLDVVLYLHPPLEVLSVPVFATVLDLAHRQHPFFPEVSTEDWVWGEREGHYVRVLPRAARIFIGTQTGKDQIIRCYGVDPANVIVNPFPTPVLARSDKPSGDDEVLSRHGLSPGFLFYPAQFWAHKNHVNLLLALRHLETAYGLKPDLVLTGSDKGNLPHVLNAIDDLALRKRVHILGFVPGNDMPSLYRNAAALVFPSFFGPDNLPALEAFSLGCPVLAGHIEGVEEQLGKAAKEPEYGAVARRLKSLSKLLVTAFKRSPPESPPDDRESTFAGYFDPTQPESIAAAMARVLQDTDFRVRLIEHGHALGAGRTPDAYVQVVLRTLDEFEPWRRTWPSAAMHCSSWIKNFPSDLSNESLFHSGIFADGWLAENSSLLLTAQQETSLLKVQGRIPYLGGDDFSTEISVRVDGILQAQMRLGAGNFEIMIGSLGRRGLHRIDLAFSDLQRLPDPDGRMVGAQLHFIGFSDQGVLPQPSEQQPKGAPGDAGTC